MGNAFYYALRVACAYVAYAYYAKFYFAHFNHALSLNVLFFNLQIIFKHSTALLTVFFTPRL